MPTLSELLNELRTLPLGNVYPKTIHGKTYHYHQFFRDGKRFTRIVKEEDLLDLVAGIMRRKEIERAIKSIRSKDVVLSKSAAELTGSVMNGNRVVATFEKGVLSFIDPDLAPLVIVRTHALEPFLKLRVIDMSRTNARILKKIMHLETDEDYKTSLYAYALSIADQYWFKPKYSKLVYQNLLLEDDSLFETALKGEVNVFYQKARLSPELTTTGSFEKGWRFIDGEWWLYKNGNARQLYSELFCSAFAALLGIPSVAYEMEGAYIRCKNFSPQTNFEPMASLVGDDDNYETVFSALIGLGESFAKDYLKMMFFDAVTNNIDRHSENMGLLRDRESGKILSLAPNFDNNLALIATNEHLNPNARKDGFIRYFVRFLEENEKAKCLFQELRFPSISMEDLTLISDSIPLDIPNKAETNEAILLRYEYLKGLFNKQHN